MINAKKARAMIEDVDLNKEQLESTFSHLEKMIIAACDKKEYSISVDLENSQLAYDIKLCLGNKALRKHVIKKMEKNGFKIKYSENFFDVSWADDDEEENEKEETAHIDVEPDDPPIQKVNHTVLKTKINKKVLLAEKKEDNSDTNSNKVVFKDPGLDFSEFDSILK